MPKNPITKKTTN